MGCESHREALSAQLDNEQPNIDASLVDAHLAQCVGCRAWLRQAVTATRAARVQPAEQVPDLTETVLTRVCTEVPGTRTAYAEDAARTEGAARRMSVTRVVLFGIAGGQWATGLATIAVPDLAGLPLHRAHELGAFNMALAAAFAWIAWRPSRAQAHLPLVSVLVAVLAGLTAVDLVAGHASAPREASHLLLVAGLACIAMLARQHAGSGPPPLGTGAGSDTGPRPGPRFPQAPVPASGQRGTASLRGRKVA